MPRGGHRDKAGRRSTWQSNCKFSETKLIRVPTAIANQLLDIAHRLDAGEVLDFVTQSKGAGLTLPSVEEGNVAPGQMSFLDLSFEIPLVEPVIATSLQPLSARALSRRLKVDKSGSIVLSRKLKPDFKEWTMEKDPEGIGWVYNEQDKLYHPATDFVTNSN
jgi:hypothetical protein